VPEFPVTVDLYHDRVHLQEFDTGWVQSEAQHAAWLADVAVAVSRALEIPLKAIAVKRRARQRGTQQYEKTGVQGQDFVVEEGGLRFIVNLDAYLDTGLFLDHRITRTMVRERASGKRFLNLFAYTGSFTVYAAAGGASASVTVDLSNTYQDWAQRNFDLSGMDRARHRLVRADVFRYLADARVQGARFDLVVLDPPSFSNSKNMQGVLDVQRDHVELIQQSLDLLSPGGELFFSTNLRSFSLDTAALGVVKIIDITAHTIPEDFRNQKIHACWLISR
jgi:23S rRNA (cytosine1962-C5)-methyltransferase